MGFLSSIVNNQAFMQSFTKQLNAPNEVNCTTCNSYEHSLPSQMMGYAKQALSKTPRYG